MTFLHGLTSTYKAGLYLEEKHTVGQLPTETFLQASVYNNSRPKKVHQHIKFGFSPL